MSSQHVITTQVDTGSGVLSGVATVNGDATNDFNIDLDADQADEHATWGLKLSECKSFVIKAAVGVTIKINDADDPDIIIIMPAGSAMQWHASMPEGYTNPFPNDVTTLYLTNTTAGNVRGSNLRDATP